METKQDTNIYDAFDPETDAWHLAGGRQQDWHENPKSKTPQPLNPKTLPQ